MKKTRLETFLFIFQRLLHLRLHKCRPLNPPLSVTTVSPAKTAKLIEMPFGFELGWAQ